MWKILLAGVAALQLAGAVPASSPKHTGLAALAKRAGLQYFGTAIDNVSNPDLFKNTSYMRLADNINEFNQWTPANAQKVFLTH